VPTSPTSDRRHSPRYIAGLAVGAAAVLFVGFLLKPRKPQSETPPPLSQIEMQRLARLAQRRSLDTMTEHFSDVARGLAGRVVQVGAGTGTGILWESNLVLTAGWAEPTPETTVVMSPDGHLLAASRSVAGPQLPLAAYTLPGETSWTGDRIDEAAALTPAEWIIAVWHQEGDLAFCPGNFMETRETSCGELAVEEVRTSLALSSEMTGGGLFDLDGALVAVILPCGDGHVALSPPSVSRLISLGRSLEGQLLAIYGLRTTPITEAAASHLGVEQGALVSEVWNGHLAAEAGLRPGDVIVSLGEQPVVSSLDLQPLLLPPELAPGPVRARRGRQTVEVDLTPQPVSGAEGAGDDGHGVRLESVAAGFVVGSVAPGSRGEEAGLRNGDRILRVDDREPRNAVELRRALARRRPVFIELERGERRLGMLLN
jgi:S1-C subfamily serine protease